MRPIAGDEADRFSVGADHLAVDERVSPKLLHQRDRHRCTMVGQMQIFGTHSEERGGGANFLTPVGLDGNRVVTHRRPGLAQRNGNHVHGGRSDERRDESVGRLVVQRTRCSHLLQKPILEHRDAITHRHGLYLVVRDIDGCRSEATLQRGDLGACLHAQLRVQIGQRLIHQEDLGFTNDGPSHGHSLTLAPGKRFGFAIKVVGEIQERCSFFDASVDLSLARLLNFQGECHVVCH